jgi:hypothetical protein
MGIVKVLFDGLVNSDMRGEVFIAMSKVSLTSTKATFCEALSWFLTQLIKWGGGRCFQHPGTMDG